MTSRQRILTTLAHQQPDRCATFEWFAPATAENLQKHLGAATRDELEAALKIDRWRNVAVPVADPPDRDARVAKFVPDRFRKMDGVRISREGIVSKIHADAKYLDDVLWHPLQDRDDTAALDEYPLPTPELLRADEAFAQKVQQLKDADAVVVCGMDQAFKTAWRLRGMENVLCDMLTAPNYVEALYDRLYAFMTAQAVAAARAGVDVIQIYGDLAMQDRMLVNPDAWRRIDKPRLTAFAAAIHAANAQTRFFMHTDGKVTEIIPDLIEAGVDILNPIQPECMDPAEIKRRFGEQLVLHGGVSVQKTLPHGQPADVRKEVRGLVDSCAPGGGFVLGPTNVVMPEFPLENVIALYEAVDA